MPPENHPNETPRATASPYLRQLEAISSPVPDLAATLSTRHEDPEENMSYVRTRFEEAPSSPSATITRTQLRRELYVNDSDLRNLTREGRRRMIANLAGSRSRIRRQSQQDEGETTYGDRIPLHESLYDWAPATDELNDAWEEPTPQFDVLNRSREPLPLQEPSNYWSLRRSIETQRVNRSRLRREPRDEPSGRAMIPYWAETSRLEGTSAHPGQSYSAATTLLQSVERNRRFSARTRQIMPNFLLDRDRLSQDRANRDVISSRLQRPELSPMIYPYYHGLTHSPSSQDLRSGHNPSLSRLKNTIRYLSNLRHCLTMEDREILVANFQASHSPQMPSLSVVDSNLIVDVSTLSGPQPSSWLSPGAAFRGSQRSPNESPTLILNRDRDHHRRRRPISTYHDAVSETDLLESMPVSLSILADAEHYTSSLSPASRRHRRLNFNRNRSPPPPPRSVPDNWPVHIVLHSIDFQTMTLSGTMSASHIPDKLSPYSPDHKPDGSSMKSFFEGEIVDFKKHSLETENFRSDGVETDVMYWRQLGPFREEYRELESVGLGGMHDAKADEMIAECLGSSDWIEKMLERWVLMRWKEKCFIAHSDASWGLTISGFYYIAMRRDTGKIEGLYYDPGSQPYQQLNLLPDGTVKEAGVSIRKQWPAFELR